MSAIRPTRSFVVRLLMVLLPGLLVGAAAYRVFMDHEVEQLRAANGARLDFYRASLVQTLEEFRLLPAVVGLDQRVVALLDGRAGEVELDTVNGYLEQVSRDPAIHAVYLLDRRGLAVAASNWREPLSFVGRNYSFRPYFHDAMAGRPGRFYGIGVTTLEAGFFLSAPVRSGSEIVGAAVVKIRLGGLEEAWRQSGDRLLVTDRLGIAVLSSSPAWKFRSLLPISEQGRAGLERTRQYLHAELAPLLDADGTPILAAAAADRVISLAPASLPSASTGERNRDYLLQSRELPEYAWQLLSFSELGEARSVALTRALAVTLAALLLLTAALLLQLRRRRLQERFAARAALERIQADLEARIAERTEALTAANRSLEERVASLKDAEQILTRTRDSAVQAGKLAVLGQMAAGITHEINQPLAALTTLADNASKMVERGRNEDAHANLGYISELAQRMGRIVSQLKIFARRGDERLTPVCVREALDNVLRLLQTRGLRPDIQVRVEHALPDLLARADPVRVEQVLLNLLTNAADAMEQQPEGKLVIICEAAEGQARITLRDSGPGIPEEVLPHLFEPFFTTKPAGKGLGLGLSISRLIVESLDGRLTAGNNPGGGAWFTVSLPLAEGPAQ